MIIRDDWCAIRYTVKIKNLHTGEEFIQNTMEFVKFKMNPTRSAHGWWRAGPSPIWPSAKACCTGRRKEALMKIHADLIAALFALLLGGMLLKMYTERDE